MQTLKRLTDVVHIAPIGPTLDAVRAYDALVFQAFEMTDIVLWPTVRMAHAASIALSTPRLTPNTS